MIDLFNVKGLANDFLIESTKKINLFDENYQHYQSHEILFIYWSKFNLIESNTKAENLQSIYREKVDLY